MKTATFQIQDGTGFYSRTRAIELSVGDRIRYSVGGRSHTEAIEAFQERETSDGMSTELVAITASHWIHDYQIIGRA